MLKADNIWKTPPGAIQIDASVGEGGGQILRTALSLSVLTGTPVVLDNIRAGRSKPGLLRQHLTCVRATAQISAARVSGDELGGSRLVFEPGPVRGGHYEFAIGTAGSCSLVLQTVLWPLLFALEPSQVLIEGGTHVDMAPSFDFLNLSFFPALSKTGTDVSLSLVRHGFFPSGGGKLKAVIQPWRERSPIRLTDRGEAVGYKAICFSASLDQDIGARQIAEVAERLHWEKDHLRRQELGKSHGIGNALTLLVCGSAHTEVVTVCGSKMRPYRQVAAEACDEMQRYLSSDAAVGEHLADQLLIPLALAGGEFTCTAISEHTRTNMEIIERFLPVTFQVSQIHESRYLVTCLSVGGIAASGFNHSVQ